MEFTCPENKPAGQGKAIEELQQGFELAKQLQSLITRSSPGDKEKSIYSSSDDLLKRISNSFSYAISLLIDNVELSEVNQSPASMAGRKSEDSEESSKSTTTMVKGRRGCYKRRKTEEEAWTTETLNWVEDGHAWRKYGQKVILNCKYPRNYYRCTNKSDGCPATKHVQQIRDDPPTYRTTHYGNHTCQDLLNQSQMLLEDNYDYAADSSFLISFDNSSNLKNKQQDHNTIFNPFLSSFSSSSLSVKHLENNVDHNCPVAQCGLTQIQPSLSDHLFSPEEWTAFQSFFHPDQTDAISRTAGTHRNFDMGCIDRFEDDLLKQYGFE
ncbi:WRKY DNA-binding protein 70 putative isoform 1 [Tripterygium wilfordii]|uniref:WRKY DNA-binding protein 70 putative isoform 1 n=1 Tax=Tripterygium wilfordii TaxID=458696 RepID=A0A7J7DWI2_TRIWF|nr:probable WRKY transcription factor 70 isoform X2 [Tripterygium wilfordii]KAF5750732.1 WRKY DNA-binding protein 70 putative isoform 1 [Tripterygium wilfordii]